MTLDSQPGSYNTITLYVPFFDERIKIVQKKDHVLFQVEIITEMQK
jgi:hypothetical protein